MVIKGNRRSVRFEEDTAPKLLDDERLKRAKVDISIPSFHLQCRNRWSWKSVELKILINELRLRIFVCSLEWNIMMCATCQPYSLAKLVYQMRCN